MSRIYVHGVGVVSPAGWGLAPFRDALAKNHPMAIKELARPGWTKPLRVRAVPSPPTRPAFMAHPRMRRTSPISQYAVAAALEALGKDATRVNGGAWRLGVVLCVMTGCVNYSRRFYDETLRDPGTASPLVFPETVFNAPSSHLAAVLGTTSINYTLVGDPGAFLQGVALAATWLAGDQVDGCLVVGAEELDWVTADAFRLFARRAVLSEGAGALYLRREASDQPAAELLAVTKPHLFFDRGSRQQAALKVREELPACAPEDLLCDGRQNISRLDAPETAAWCDGRGARLSLKIILGEGLMAAAAWQCVAAVDAAQQGRHATANVSVVGCDQQAIGAKFTRVES